MSASRAKAIFSRLSQDTPLWPGPISSSATSRASTIDVARTDARTSLGLDEALRRGEAYAHAGVLFIESPENEDELARIGRAFDLLGGRTPVLRAKRLAALGFRIGIYAAVGFLAMAEALRRAYDSTAAGELQPPVPLYDFSAFNELIGFPEIWAFERRYARNIGADKSARQHSDRVVVPPSSAAQLFGLGEFAFEPLSVGNVHDQQLFKLSQQFLRWCSVVGVALQLRNEHSLALDALFALGHMSASRGQVLQDDGPIHANSSSHRTHKGALAQTQRVRSG
jgi:hypothetical protein